MNINNISPTVWGPPGWKFMHYITFTYPINPNIEDKENYKNFFEIVGKVLPCNSCRINFNKHLKKYPLTDYVLSTKKNLIEWFVNIHNEVNIMNGKPIMTPNQVMNLYLRNNNSIFNFTLSKKVKNVLLIIFIIAILIFILKYYKLNKNNPYFSVNVY
jgi:hypothetical protein